MSYDLRIAVKVADTEDNTFIDIATPDYDEPTYNLGKMFRACTGWDFEQGKYYRVSEVYENIERGINELTYNEERYIPLNPDNGWGNTKSALVALKSLKECIDNITGWNTLPMSCMWVAW